MLPMVDIPKSSGSDDRILSSRKMVDDCGDVAPQPSDFLRFAFAKARSLTSGTSIGSTAESSSQSTSESSSISDEHSEDCLDVTNDVHVVLANNNDSNCDFPSLLSSPEEDDELDEIFYDCRSQASFSSLPSDPDHEIAMYVDGKCVYSDGRPAFVPPGQCTAKVPYDFLEFCGFNEVEARKMWENTKKWRQEHDIWNIHTRPNVCFEDAKRYYPSCYHGYSKDGTVLEYSFPGRMKPRALIPTRAAIDDLLEHHCFMQEYVSNSLYTDRKSWHEVGKEPLEVNLDKPDTPTKGVIVVIDVKGSGPHLLSVDVFSFLKRMTANSCSHYPCFAARVLIINSPFWVAGVFATIRPLLPEILPVEIVSEAKTLSTLRKYVDDDQIPVHYGGSCPYPLHRHPFELRLHQTAQEAATYATDSSAADLLKPENSDSVDAIDDITSASSFYSSHTSNVEDDAEPVSGCVPLPFCGSLQCHESPFVSDAAGDYGLTLTPQQPSLDLVGVTRNLWDSIMYGFDDSCGKRKN